ncbi:hypothetical protein NL108_015337 [Boleophthalmus pectinirostris]|nr:hypothetical protein NL108_015337 [Boleophthalmus pectinirostris]
MDQESDSSSSPRAVDLEDLSPAPRMVDMLEAHSLGLLEGACLAKVELRVTCKGVQDRDPRTKPDPCVVLNTKTRGHWTEVDRSEVVRTSMNPSFSKVFTLDFFFEEVQRLRFDLYDVFGPRDSDFLGSVECTLAQASPDPDPDPD